MANVENILPVFSAAQDRQDPSPTKIRYGCRNIPLCRSLFLEEQALSDLPFSGGLEELWRGKQLVKDHTAKERGWGWPVDLWAARADYIQTPSLLA